MIQPATAARLTRKLATAQAEARLPSIAGGVVRDGELIWSDARGTVDGRCGGVAADANTQYRMGSITKTLVAVVIMRLRDEGVLDLADPFDRHVPDTPIGHVTVAQLLSHGSGLQAETDGPWWERTPGGDWSTLADRIALRHQPGRRFHYSNVGYAALGELIARVRGHDWAHAVAAEILEPLGMSRTTTRPVPPHAVGLAVHPYADVVLTEPEHDAGAMAPAGQLWSTVDDLARWAAFLAGRTSGVLDPDSLAEMRTPLVVDDTPGAPWTAAHGLGVQVWNVDGRRFVGHGGSMPGFLATVRVDVESGDGVVLFTNSTSGLPRTLTSDLLSELGAAEPVPVRTWHATDGDAAHLELVGPWYWGPASFVLRAGGDGMLHLGPAAGAGRASRFRPDGPDRWLGLDGYYAGEPLQVVRASDGTVSHLDLASFRFSRTPYAPDADVPGGVDQAGWH